MKILHVFALATTAESFFDGQFRYLSDNGHEIDLVCSPNPEVYEFANLNNIRYIEIPVSRILLLKEDWRTLKRLIKLIRQEKYDIVVGHTPKGALLSMIASKIAGCKKRVYLRHGLIYTTAMGLKRTILKLEEHFVSSLATHILNVSPSLSKLAISDHLNSDKKQTVIGKGTCGGIDTFEKFNPQNIDSSRLKELRNSLGISDVDYVIGFCGRLCKDKGIIELIDGFKLFKEENPNIKSKLLLVGGFDNRDILPQSVRDTINLDNDIIHTGFIIKDIQYYYALMNVFVFPSHREGFGMCSIEAQAMGIPVLAAKSHGCIDTIEEHKTGEYIDLTPESIAEKLRLFTQEPYRNTYNQYCRDFVVNNFERQNLWPQILDYYNSI